MLSIQEMIHRFQMGLNKVATEQKPDLRVSRMIMYLNDAQDKLVESDYAVDPATKLGFEVVQKRIDDLQNLHVTFERLAAKGIKKGVVGFSLADLKSKYLHITRLVFIGQQGTCRDVELTPVSAQTDDLNVILNNPDTAPDFGWREVPYRIAGGRIEAFVSDFDLTACEVDYLRYPRYMDIEGYKHFDGTASTTVQCEMNRMYQLKIIDRAVELAALDLNSPMLQAAQLKALSNPK